MRWKKNNENSRTIFPYFFPVFVSRIFLPVLFSIVATFEIQRFKISVSCFSSTCRYSTVHVPCGISIQTSPASILFSLSASYNLIIFYELALLLVICPFPAILFSLSASYNLIIFYELALLLVICPFPAILFSLSPSFFLLFFLQKDKQWIVTRY
jgi:hypothetical protein